MMSATDDLGLLGRRDHDNRQFLILLLRHNWNEQMVIVRLLKHSYLNCIFPLVTANAINGLR